MLRRAVFVFLLAAACGGSDKPAVESPEETVDEGDGDEEQRTGDRRSAVPDVDGEDDDGMEVRGLRGRLEQYDNIVGFPFHLFHKSQGMENRLYIPGLIGGEFGGPHKGNGGPVFSGYLQDLL